MRLGWSRGGEECVRRYPGFVAFVHHARIISFHPLHYNFFYLLVTFLLQVQALLHYTTTRPNEICNLDGCSVIHM